MPIRGYIIEKYNAMTNAYTCNRLVQEASALDMDLQIVGTTILWSLRMVL